MHIIRRTHLYVGLFLMPWAVLYGVTGFLFNHPVAFPDTPTATFGRDALRGTPLADPPSPAAEAERVVAALQARSELPSARYALVAPELAAFTREFAFATIKADGRTLNVLLDVTGAGGTIRVQPPEPERKPAGRAPFAIGGPTPRAGGAESPRANTEGLRLDDPLPDRVAAAVPAVLESTGFPRGDVTVTSVPDLAFRMRDQDGATWAVTYSPMTGTVTGKPADGAPKEPPSVRRFVTRLHLTHTYPPAGGVRQWWAAVVDATAAAMVFWGVSGLLMWWQVKATRGWGVATLALSAAAAVALAAAMYGVVAGN